jgi:TetR/AcrR family transcriptional regulator, regulator of autoinduction and epiphytic fitness
MPTTEARVAREVRNPPTTNDLSPTDGRLLRGERTRVRVIESLLELVAEGELCPTAQQVADRANVALRTIYHHFDDAEGLRRTALDFQLQRRVELLGAVDPALPLSDRIQAVSRAIRQLFEAITPIRRTSLIDDQLSSEESARIAQMRKARRHFIEEAFAPELDSLGSQRAATLDAIDVASSWPKWHYSRANLGQTPLAAERLLAFNLRSILCSGLTANGSKRRRGS